MTNTMVASCIAIANESGSSLAATIRQGTWKPVASPWPAIFDKCLDDAFHEDSSDLKLIFSQLSSTQLTCFQVLSISCPKSRPHEHEIIVN